MPDETHTRTFRINVNETKEQWLQHVSDQVSLELNTNPEVQAALHTWGDDPTPENHMILTSLLASKVASMLGEQYGLSTEDIAWLRAVMEKIELSTAFINE